jgi:hypothetical protein
LIFSTPKCLLVIVYPIIQRMTECRFELLHSAQIAHFIRNPFRFGVAAFLPQRHVSRLKACEHSQKLRPTHLPTCTTQTEFWSSTFFSLWQQIELMLSKGSKVMQLRYHPGWAAGTWKLRGEWERWVWGWENTKKIRTDKPKLFCPGSALWIALGLKPGGCEFTGYFCLVPSERTVYHFSIISCPITKIVTLHTEELCGFTQTLHDNSWEN